MMVKSEVFGKNKEHGNKAGSKPLEVNLDDVYSLLKPAFTEHNYSAVR